MKSINEGRTLPLHHLDDSSYHLHLSNYLVLNVEKQLKHSAIFNHFCNQKKDKRI